MAYTKTTWVDNNLPAINSTNLNNIENGIEANDTAISQLQSTVTYKGTVLYNNVNGATGNITFDGNYNDYDYVLITDDLGTGILTPSVKNNIIISATSYSDMLYQEYDNIKFAYSSTTLKTTVSHQYQGNYYNGANHSVNRKIYKIVGYNI